MLEQNLSQDQKKKLAHLANLVKLSLADKVIRHGEQKFLDRYAKDLGLSKTEYHDVLLHPDKYQYNLELTTDERIERLYYLVKLSFSDGEILNDEILELEKIARTLNFPKGRVEKLIKKAIHLVINKYELQKFVKRIRKFLEN